jgi:nuclear GTP-binding protein
MMKKLGNNKMDVDDGEDEEEEEEDGDDEEEEEEDGDDENDEDNEDENNDMAISRDVNHYDNNNDDNNNDNNNDDDNIGTINHKNYGQNSRRAYLSELRKVIERADVILHILDARDPLGTKSTSVEDMVSRYPYKKLVYILNKADLVPKNILIDWLTYLRKTYPTIPFKCNTQQQKNNLSIGIGKVTHQQNDSMLKNNNRTIGAEELLGR